MDAVLCAAVERRDLQRSHESSGEAATEDADCLLASSSFVAAGLSSIRPALKKRIAVVDRAPDMS